MGETILGPRAKRVKTTAELPTMLAKRLDWLAAKLGTSKNAILALALGKFLAEFMPLESNHKKRLRMVYELEEFFQTTIQWLKERA
jgi:hypothetical protein